jgi:diacylglycerol kinase (ATP)
MLLVIPLLEPWPPLSMKMLLGKKLFSAVVLTPVAIYFGETAIDQALMISSLLFIIIVELLNSSIEATVDRISVKHHKLAKRAKDIGSAAVFFSLLMLL